MRKLILLFFSCLALPLFATTNIDMYRASIMLEPNSPTADADARIEGLKEVITKATGNENSLNNPIIANGIKNPTQYLQRFSYAPAGNDQFLEMQFNPTEINRLLDSAKIATWGKNRPNILIWLVNDDGTKKAINWDDSDNPNVQLIKNQANKLGLPTTFPIGDIDDFTSISLTDLWGNFAHPIGIASQRYPVDGVLVILNDNNKTRWFLYDKTPAQIASSPQITESGVLASNLELDQIIDKVTNFYLKKNAATFSASPSSAFTIVFSNVSESADYFMLQNKMMNLPSVANVSIKEIKGTSITFQVKLFSTAEEFKKEMMQTGLVDNINSTEHSTQQ